MGKHLVKREKNLLKSKFLYFHSFAWESKGFPLFVFFKFEQKARIKAKLFANSIIT